MNIEKIVKRKENGEIWICKKILDKMPPVNTNPLFELSSLTEDKIAEQLACSKNSISFKLEKNLDLEYFTSLNFSLFKHNALFSPTEEEPLELYNARLSLVDIKKVIKIVGGKKSALTNRKNKLEAEYIANSRSKQFREHIFPKLILCLYEAYKEPYEKLEKTYNDLQLLYKEQEIIYKELKNKLIYKGEI